MKVCETLHFLIHYALFRGISEYVALLKKPHDESRHKYVEGNISGHSRMKGQGFVCESKGIVEVGRREKAG